MKSLKVILIEKAGLHSNVFLRLASLLTKYHIWSLLRNKHLEKLQVTGACIT
jgi:hypothetical protein